MGSLLTHFIKYKILGKFIFKDTVSMICHKFEEHDKVKNLHTNGRPHCLE